MALTAASENPIKIDGFSLNETAVAAADLATHTHETFHNAATILVENNTPQGLLRLLVAEIDELLEVLEEDSADRVGVVAETGDLFHFWNDLFKLSGFSMEAFLQYVGPGLRSDNGAMIGELKQTATEVYAGQLDARNLLYELKAFLMMRQSEVIDEELVGVIATYIFAVAAALDINVIYATLMKNLRNRAKYDPAEMNTLHAEGLGYDAIRAKMAEKWSNGRGGDERFFGEFLGEFPLELSWVVATSLATDE